MNIDGSNQKRITQKTGGYPLFITPNEKWLYYQAGAFRYLLKISLETGEEIKVDKNIGSNVAFSSSGELLAYFKKDENEKTKLFVKSLNDNQIIKEFSLVEGKGRQLFLRWR
jgi:predicted DNA-binding antitoxin AbrB/MazE fold protein